VVQVQSSSKRRDPGQFRDLIRRELAKGVRDRSFSTRRLTTILESRSRVLRIAAIREITSELLLCFAIAKKPVPKAVHALVLGAIHALPFATTDGEIANDIATAELLRRIGFAAMRGELGSRSPSLADWPRFCEWAAEVHHLAIPGAPLPKTFFSIGVADAISRGTVLAAMEGDYVRVSRLIRWVAIVGSPRHSRSLSWAALAEHAVAVTNDALIGLNCAIASRIGRWRP
jgi:hypothetical protein